MFLQGQEIWTSIVTEWRKCENRRRRPCANQGDRPPKKPALKTLWSWSSSFQDCEKIDFRCLHTHTHTHTKLSHRSSSTSSTKIVSRGFSSDAYSTLKFFLTGIICQSAVCEIINTLCNFVLLSWEQCRIDGTRTPVFGRHTLAAVNPKSWVCPSQPLGERRLIEISPSLILIQKLYTSSKLSQEAKETLQNYLIVK